MSNRQIANHIRAELATRFPFLTADELVATVRTSDDDPGGWCDRGGLVWINSENGLPSWSYEMLVAEALFHVAPDGYFVEPVNASVAVAYEV